MKKVSDEHLQDIRNTREQLTEIIYNTGELHLRKMLLEKELLEIDSVIALQEKKFLEFQKQETVLYEKLQTEYGTASINVDTGEILE